jgi:thiopurine S-methyltransferase
MNEDFWHQRWNQNQIGFHQQQGNRKLNRFWSKTRAASGGRVFVPLCGKSMDMIWLHQAGYKVVGVELSPIATADFFRENNLEFRTRPHGGMTLWESEGLSIYCGDFFTLGSQDLHDVVAVYERASLVAFPAAMRPRYADHLLSILPPAANMLLLTLTYPQQQMQGPPFSVPDEEVRNLFSEDYSVDLLASDDVLEEHQRFREKGLTSLFESVYLLTPK